MKKDGISKHEMIYGDLNQRVYGKALKVCLVRCLSNCDCQEVFEGPMVCIGCNR